MVGCVYILYHQSSNNNNNSASKVLVSRVAQAKLVRGRERQTHKQRKKRKKIMVSTRRSGSLSAKRSSYSDDNNNSNSRRSSSSEDNHSTKPPSPKRLKVQKQNKLKDFFGVVLENVFDLFFWISGREWWSYRETDTDDGEF